MQKLYSYIFPLWLMLLLISCVKEQPKIVPDEPICIEINLDLPEFRDLMGIGNAYKHHYQGFRDNGVIVYRRTEAEFYAWDATCPQHIEENASVEFDDGIAGGSVKCPNCNTIYYLYNFAYPEEGHPLKAYKVSYGYNFVKVYYVLGANCREY